MISAQYLLPGGSSKAEGPLFCGGIVCWDLGEIPGISALLSPCSCLAAMNSDFAPLIKGLVLSLGMEDSFEKDRNLTAEMLF